MEVEGVFICRGGDPFWPVFEGRQTLMQNTSDVHANLCRLFSIFGILARSFYKDFERLMSSALINSFSHHRKSSQGHQSTSNSFYLKGNILGLGFAWAQ